MVEFAESAGIYVVDDDFGTHATASLLSLLRRWNGSSVGAAAGVRGGHGARGNPAIYLPFGAALCKTFSHQSTYTWGERIRISTLGGVGGGDHIVFQNNSQILVTLSFNLSGFITVTGNNTSTTVICATSESVVKPDKDTYVELSATISADALGDMSVAAEVRINGVHVIRGSAAIGRNLSTLTNGGATFNRVTVSSGVVTNGQCYLSDIYLTNGSGDTNTGFLARASFPYLIVVPIFTISDTLDLAWTPSRAGTHWDLVNENPADDDTTYLAAATPGLVDSWNWQPIPSFTGTVRSVQLSLLARSTDEGTRSVKGNIGPAGAEQQTDEFGLCSSYLYRHQAFDKDPATAREWTRQGFNAKPFGGTLTQ